MSRGLLDSPEARADRPPATGWRRHLPNLLSLSRLLLLPVALYLLTLPQGWAPPTAAAVMLFGMLIDALDGMLARRWNAVTEFGKLLDPIADKICINAAAIMLVIYRDFPLWLAAVIIGRDLLILLGGLFLRRRLKTIPMSTYLGKAAAFTLGATLIVFTLRTGLLWLERASVWLSVALIAASLGAYLYRYLEQSRRPAPAADDLEEDE